MLDVEKYKVFTKVWNSFTQNGTMRALEDRFLPVFEQICQSYDPSKGPLVPYIKRKIGWSLQVRTQQRARDYYRAAGYIAHLGEEGKSLGTYGNRIIANETLNKLIKEAELSEHEKVVLHTYYLNEDEPTLREAGAMLNVSGARVQQITQRILNKLKKTYEKGRTNEINNRRHFLDLLKSEEQHRRRNSKVSG